MEQQVLQGQTVNQVYQELQAPMELQAVLQVLQEQTVNQD
jgi:prophage tail gpP-like protein